LLALEAMVGQTKGILADLRKAQEAAATEPTGPQAGEGRPVTACPPPGNEASRGRLGSGSSAAPSRGVWSQPPSVAGDDRHWPPEASYSDGQAAALLFQNGPKTSNYRKAQSVAREHRPTRHG
jgi:hypothetical protein